MNDRQQRLGETFRRLHAGPDIFVMPNAYDIGSAQMLAGLGARAIATASAGLAGTLGLPDGAVGRDQALAHARAVAASIDIPVSGDLENGYADDPGGVAETIRLASEAGLAGCGIEDKVHGGTAFYDFDHAVARIAAAVAAVKALDFPFTLTARADGVLGGAYDLDEALRRAAAFAEAGAGCVFVPGISEDQALARLCAGVTAPVSHLTGIAATGCSVSDLAALGVRRVSTGPFLFRTALGAAARAAIALLGDGDVSALVAKDGWAEADKAMRAGKRGD